MIRLFRSAARRMAGLASVVVFLLPVSYTHLTLPTKA